MNGGWARWSRPLALGVTLLLLALAVFEMGIVVPRMIAARYTIGVDFHQYQDHARRWLGGGGFYLPQQLAGPYVVYDLIPPLYPPVFLLLILPFLWLPELVWWIIPLAVMGLVLWRWRPSPWTWALIAALVAWPRTWEIVCFGNPSMWIAAFAALGTVAGWPYVLVLLKPSLAPLALPGIRRRSWWIALVVLGLVSLPFGSMWLDYVTAIRNADEGVLYSLRDVPIVLIPIVAWWGGQRRVRGVRPTGAVGGA